MNAVSASTSPRHQAPLIEEDFFGFLILQVSEFLCVCVVVSCYTWNTGGGLRDFAEKTVEWL